MKLDLYISFILLIFFLLNGCKENLVRIKSETDANKILLSLRENGVGATKTLEATEWIIKVDESQFTEALSVLDRKRLYGRMVGAEKKSESDLFSTHAQKTNEILERIGEKLSESILMIPGVIDARVHIYKEDTDSILNIVHKQSASVVLVSEQSTNINHDQIKVIVSKGAGVPLEFVAVIESFVQKQDTEQDLTKASPLPEDSAAQKEIFRIYSYFSIKKVTTTVGVLISLLVAVLSIQKIFSYLMNRKSENAITKILES